ncbi:probable serine/threonine-protein kinase DDB_G0282963 [Vespa crabro]|uniref:probable serine/threonine-protein kinase DDB_G0282963 n=1 Tax=Vespa crabro TaxID=7445 RepID=UPI001F0138A0|nr:probable serine/threonine-protein kinase DDB_G0282963 [Vespa crabro]
MDNKQVTECIREFKLRQQYPSIAPKQKNKNLPKVRVETKTCLQLSPRNTECTLPINVQKKDGFHKLRLKLPSGKDLGEFNVQMLSFNNNIVKSKTLINQNKCKNLNKSIILSNIMLKDKENKLVTIVPLRCTNVNKNINISKLDNTVSSKKDNNNIDEKCQGKTVFLKHIVTTDENHKEGQNKNTTNMDTDITNNECYKNGESECNQIPKTKSKDVFLDKSALENIKKLGNTDSLSELSEHVLISESENVIDTFSNQSVNMSNNIIKIVNKNSDLGYSIFDDNVLFNNTKKELYLLSMNNEDIDTSFEETPNTTYNQKKIKNISDHQNMIEQNMTVHDNGISLSDNYITIKDNYDAKHNNDNEYSNVSLRYNNDSIPIVIAKNGHKHFKSQNVNNHSIKNHFDDNIPLQKSLSSSWSTLKDIVTIKDEQMRIKAFKALADCIVINQQIPSHLPTDLKTVCDIKVQTNNSLFEPKNFASKKENTFGIPKIKLKESYSANTIENSNTNLLNDMNENSVFSLFHQSQESNIYLEKITDDVCNKNSGANRVKQILLQANPFYNKIFKQLQRDFETAAQWDENGMLNIHRAVISNRIYDVQRHLMVLEACNINIDILSESHETSLELAVKHNVSIEIVKLLLKAGANPVSLKPIHETALIIASKTNSLLLPELVKHVPCIKLLNNIDSTGFAPLHYCALYGNLKGVISLINMGANVNLRENRSGRTPLFLAIENKHSAIAQKLIEKGASINIPNFSGQTIISLPT